MVMVKLKMKAIYKTFLSLIAILIIACGGLGVLYMFSEKGLITDSDIETNGILSINFIDGKYINTEDTQYIKFSVTNSTKDEINYTINFIKIRGTGKYKLKTSEEIILEGKLTTADEINTEYISLAPEETKEFELELINSGEGMLKGQVGIRSQEGKLNTFKDLILSNVTPTETTLTKVGTEVATLDEGLIKSSDDVGTSYYFRGNIQSNYVLFGGLNWRIVRINGDGTVRLILDGVTDTVANYYTQNNYNFENSNMNEFLEGWLHDNLSDNLKLIANTKFCSDIGHDGMHNYTAFTRVITNKIPTLNCLGTEVNNSIGLLTIDEVILAGASPSGFNESYYLHNSNITDMWYTLSAASGNESYINMFMVESNGSIKTDLSGNLYRNVRPVINLVKNIQMTGEGTITNPYKLAE